MLNNTQITDAVANVIGHELGLDRETATKELVDTRDTFEDFATAARTLSGKWHERNGVKYFYGEIQRRIGMPRVTFMFIPGEEFNFVYKGYDGE